MNHSDIDYAVQRNRNHPVLSRASKILAELRDRVDGMSDGWCYWRAPVTAAYKLMLLIEARREDTTDAQLKAALTPIRSFCTKHPAIGWRP